MCSGEHVQRLSKREAVDREKTREDGWNAPGRSSFLGNFACAARWGVWTALYTPTQRR